MPAFENCFDEVLRGLLHVDVVPGRGGEPAGESLVPSEGVQAVVVGGGAAGGLVALVPHQHARNGATVGHQHLS